MSPLVSIIMPVYNAARYLPDAIDSVLNQTYGNWELILIDDGSTDDSVSIMEQKQTGRMRILRQSNRGVSSARNAGLNIMKGELFCFLDADDVMPPHSLESRVSVFERNAQISFVDGTVIRKSIDLSRTISTFTPSFKGNPHAQLVRLSPRCFVGNTWMIRRENNRRYQFHEQVTHLEDLLFYIDISHSGLYDYVEDPILWYRQVSGSAMRNLRGLEKSYVYVINYVRRNELATRAQLLYLRYKVARIMFLSYLRINRDPISAVKSIVKSLG